MWWTQKTVSCKRFQESLQQIGVILQMHKGDLHLDVSAKFICPAVDTCADSTHVIHVNLTVQTAFGETGKPLPTWTVT